MNKKLLIPFAIVIAVAGASWFYYTTTIDYAIGRIKQACLEQNYQDFASFGIGHIKGETRELTADELDKIGEFAERAGEKAECPFKKGGEVTKEKMTAEDLKKYGVPDGYLLTFEGLDQPMKVVKFNGSWRPIVIDFDFDLNMPEMQSAPGTPNFSTSPNYAVPGGDVQIEYNSGSPAPQP